VATNGTAIISQASARFTTLMSQCANIGRIEPERGSKNTERSQETEESEEEAGSNGVKFTNGRKNYIFNPFSLTKMANSFIPLWFGNFPKHESLLLLF